MIGTTGSCSPLMDRISQLAAAWTVKHPHLKSRIERAVGLVGKVRHIEGNIYAVQGSKDEYTVSIDPDHGSSICMCEDSRRGHKCKHRLAVALVYASTHESEPKPTMTDKQVEMLFDRASRNRSRKG